VTRSQVPSFKRYSRAHDERDLQVLAMYEGRVPLRRIAARFGLTTGQVAGIVHRCLRGG
jgi:transposase-like protein